MTDRKEGTSDSARFVATFSLRTTPRDESALRIRFVAARYAYNALLGECLRRSRLMRESKAWSKARRMAKGSGRTSAFRECEVKHQFREYDLYQFMQKQRIGWIGHHLDTKTLQSLACRAFKAVRKSIYDKSNVRFRRRAEVESVEGRSSESPLRWSGEGVTWRGLRIPAVINPHDEVQRHALKCTATICRIVRKSIRGRDRYFAQIICKGEPYKEPQHTPAIGIVGLDIGPSTIAVVGEKAGSLERFAQEVLNAEASVRQLQRRADRQIRAGNPQCFDNNGRWHKGIRATNITKALRRTRRKVAEIRRRQQAHRRNLHGQLAHRVLSLGNDVRTEKLSYRSFQRSFGKSVGVRAPGDFMARLRATATKYGATVTEFETRTTKLSQTCICGTIKKKLLSERTHHCDCGVTAQRDLFSAYLARHVTANRLDVDQAREAWPGLCNVLQTASMAYQRCDGSASAGTTRKGRAASCAKVRCKPVSAADVVAVDETARAAENPVEPEVTYCKPPPMTDSGAATLDAMPKCTQFRQTISLGSNSTNSTRRSTARKARARSQCPATRR